MLHREVGFRERLARRRSRARSAGEHLPITRIRKLSRRWNLAGDKNAERLSSMAAA